MFIYYSGSGTSSVGMDPYIFMTRKMSDTIECMANELHCIIKKNKNLLNMDGVDTSKKFNYYSVILYYADVNLKEKPSLGFHSECVYSPINGDFVTRSSSQVENKPAVIYSIGYSRNLRLKQRKIGLSNTGHRKWINDTSFNLFYSMGSNTITIVNPLDKNSLNQKNVINKQQYIHGGVNITGENISAGIVFRVVNTKERYNMKDDTMVVSDMPHHNETIYGILGLNLAMF